MKISKIFLFTAAALALCGACDDSDDKVDPSTTEDKISISPTEGVVGSKGGDVSTMVTSSGEWTLEGAENAYVTPSAAKGKDGDIVAFTVKANDKEEDQVFTYTFACGKKTAPFKITLKKKASETEEQLELFYAEESNIIPREGGKVTVLVTSSGAWTLEGTADFVHPSSTSGEDGAEVVFEVDPNETEQERSADYVFKMGSKQVEFQIVEKGEVPETIEITSKAEMRLAYTAEERLAVELSTNVNYRDLTAEIVSEAEGWLTYTIARPTEGGADTDVTAYFSMAKNDGETPREATVTIKGVKNGAAVLKVTQLPQSKIEPEKLAYFLDVEAQTLDIPVTANVEFDVTVGEGADGWFTYNNADDSGLHFTVEALVDGSARSCEVVLTEKNAPDNAEPLTVNIKISQKSKGLIECVADMRRARCYFPYLKNANALNGLKNGAMEALVNIQDTRVAGSLSTIMGIEGKFLLRLGDVGVPWNQIQLAMSGGNRTDAKLELSELDRWYHVAVTWDYTFAYFYVDGELLYQAGISNYSGFNLGVAYGGRESDWNRAFWIGYAYNADRFFPGYMAEVRVWNRTLTKEEINAENHFYSVPVDSEGLVGYWKLNDGAGAIVKDSSPSGNDMVGEINVRSSNGQQIGDEGMNWVEMSLP